MSIKYNHNGNTVQIFDFNDDQVKAKIEPAIYSVSFNKFMGYFLTKEGDNFILPKKVYGNAKKRSKKILRTYQDRTKNTGVILVGEKGAGKSLLSQVLGNRVISKLNLPVILVQEPFYGDDFLSFINKIGDCIIILDEFAKTYKADEDNDNLQEKLLTMFDGATGAMTESKILFVVLENDMYRLDNFIINRPGRFFYRFEYDKMELAAIKEYCKDKKLSKDFISDLMDYVKSRTAFSFDVLQSIVEEHIRYNETLSEIVESLNVERPDEFETVIVRKVIDKGSNSEIPLKDDARWESYDLYIVNIVKDREKFEEEYKGTDSYVNNEDITLQDGSVKVFDNGDFIIVTETIKEAKIDYKRLLAF